jgi:hypothetical protein
MYAPSASSHGRHGFGDSVPAPWLRRPIRPDTRHPPGGADWRSDFDLSPDDLTTTGRNPFFILEPRFQLILEGGGEKVTITVLNETETVGAFTTRVVEEREEKNGELREVSRNYFAISKATGDVFYFGEAVDIYRNGELVRHEGAWRADEADAKPGLIMPGGPAIGMKYYQEVAPGKAMDRAKVVSLDETLRTPAGIFRDCLKTQETTPLNSLENEYKTYAPDIGLIQDEKLLLTNYGFVELED